MAVIDPGPDLDAHRRAVLRAIGRATRVQVLLTHGHGDHADGSLRLCRESQGALFLSPGQRLEMDASGVDARDLEEGQKIETDQGLLEVLQVPGHTKDHVAFHWIPEDALFVGDLLLGKGDTTWIGEYPGCVADYLVSLEKIERLGCRVIYPGHGPPILDPTSAIARFREHRRMRIEDVRRAHLLQPEASPLALAEGIYGGDIPEKLARAATRSVEVILHHLDREGA